MKCSICHKNTLNNYCTSNICKECCEDGKCPTKYKCSIYTKILEKKNKPYIKIECSADDFPDYCEDCNRVWGDVIDDDIYNSEIKKQREYQKKYDKQLDKDFLKKLSDTSDSRQLNLYIQKESSKYAVAILISLREKLRIKNIRDKEKKK